MSRIADLIIEQGRVAAAARQQSGAAWGQAVQNIGAAPGQAIAAYQDKQARDSASALATSRDLREQQGADDSHQQHLAALEQVRQQQLSQWAERHIVNQSTPEQIAASVDDLPGTWTPQEREGIKARVATDPTTFLKSVAPLREPKPAEPYTLKDANGNEIRYSGDNTELARTDAPKTFAPPTPPVPPRLTFGTPTPVMIGGKRMLIRPGSDGGTYDLDGKRVPTTDIRPDVPPKDATNEPLVAIMRDGRPILVPRSQAVNQTPATTREQGRPVTSGDAGRVAEIDQSLDDIGRLGKSIAAAGETGTVAKIGASAPNWITDLTGWGTDAKKKQALIDRVKQVIGKALEGGVLRKEDELKYEKILPTIGDTNEVVKSKLGGLDEAIRGKRERLVESLTDAGYETSRFARTEKGAVLAPGKTQRVVQNGVTYEVTTDANGKVTSSKAVP